jgi:hypothetical protein
MVSGSIVLQRHCERRDAIEGNGIVLRPWIASSLTLLAMTIGWFREVPGSGPGMTESLDNTLLSSSPGLTWRSPDGSSIEAA